MVWNHRVIKRSFRGEDFYQIHEVYYNDKKKPYLWTNDPIAPGGASLQELREELQRMLRCLDTPILIEDGDKLKELEEV